MTPIYDTNDVPLRLHVQQQFATHQHEELDVVLRILKEKSAEWLAHRILDDKKFFDLNIERGYGSLRSSVIVMTEAEYAAKLESQFKAGLRHAQGFMPTWEKV